MENGRVSATIYHLARTKTYDREKPFIANFSIAGIKGAKQWNHEFTAEQVLISDARDRTFSLEKEGFTFLKHKSSVSGEDWIDKDVVETQYFDEIEELVKSFGEYKDIVFFDYQSRERSPMYPTEDLFKYSYDQPLRLAHVDLTAADAVRRLKTMPAEEYGTHDGRSFDILTIWRLQEKSYDDWPLAVCDYQSINPARDVLHNDLLFVDLIAENSLLLHDPAHKWYYLKGQDVDDVVLFRNASFGRGEKPVAFHAAFQNPDSGHHRKSIEVRVAAFLD